MRNYFPFLMFPQCSLLSKTQLQNIHRSLGHPSVETKKQIVQQAEIDDSPSDTKRLITDIVKYCHACQLQRRKPGDSCFLLKIP